MENTLKRLDEFNTALSDYEVSAQSRKVLDKTRLLLMLAPSASGRNTVIHKLLDTGDYYFIVSDTTRKPRLNNGVLEKNGREYWFRTEDDMLADLKSGKLLEAEVIHNQQVSGISIRELEKANKKGKIAVTDIDIGGVETIVSAKPDTVVVLLISPSFDEWLQRIKGRGDMADAELKRRFETATRIFKFALKTHAMHVVINDSLDKAVDEIHEISFKEKGYTETDKHKLNLLEDLLEKTQDWLSNN